MSTSIASLRVLHIFIFLFGDSDIQWVKASEKEQTIDFSYNAATSLNNKESIQSVQVGCIEYWFLEVLLWNLFHCVCYLRIMPSVPTLPGTQAFECLFRIFVIIFFFFSPKSARKFGKYKPEQPDRTQRHRKCNFVLPLLNARGKRQDSKRKTGVKCLWSSHFVLFDANIINV